MEQPEAANPGESPFAGGMAGKPGAPIVAQPRIAISHLMLWILGSAMILGVYRLIQPDDASLPSPQRSVQQIYMALGSFLYGVQVAAIFVLGARLVTRHGPLAREPGHWLLVRGGGSCLISWFTIGVIRCFVGANFAAAGFTYLPVILLGFAVPSMALDLWAIAMLRREWAWRALFGLLAVPSAMNALLAVLMLVEQLLERDGPSFTAGSVTMFFMQWNSLQTWLGQVIGLLCLCGLVIIDFRRKRRRDWLHFAGVAAEAGSFLLTLAIQILQALVL